MNDKEIKELIFSRLLLFNNQVRKDLRGAVNEKLDEMCSISDRKFRLMIVEMIEDGFPIGTSPDSGYFLVNSQERFDEATASLKAKIGGLARRIQNLKKATEDRFNIHIQLELFDKAV